MHDALVAEAPCVHALSTVSGRECSEAHQAGRYSTSRRRSPTTHLIITPHSNQTHINTHPRRPKRRCRIPKLHPPKEPISKHPIPSPPLPRLRTHMKHPIQIQTIRRPQIPVPRPREGICPSCGPVGEYFAEEGPCDAVGGGADLDAGGGGEEEVAAGGVAAKCGVWLCER